MKSITTAIGLIALLSVGIVPPCHADDCAKIEELARAIMQKRQENVSIAVMAATLDKSTESEDARRIFRAMLRDAYGQPAYNTPDFQRRAVDQFANQVYLTCDKARAKQ